MKKGDEYEDQHLDPREARQVFPEGQKRSSREVYFYSSGGEKIYPLDPYYCLSAITIEDIATSLSLAFKFNGMSKRPYSMAEHSIHLAGLVRSQCSNPEQARLALLSTADVMGFGIRSVLQFNTPAEMALERMTWVEAVWKEFAKPVTVDTEILQQARNAVLVAERLELLVIADSNDRIGMEGLSFESQVQVEWVRSEIDRNDIWYKNLAAENLKDEYLQFYCELSVEIGDIDRKEK